jgi:hypothetical protein
MMRKASPPFLELTWFAIQALDKIYNESPQAREAVIKHYGLYHHPYNEKFRRFQGKLRRSNLKL